MAGRVSVFSDPAVIELITSRFIPVAENSSALERQTDAKGEFFRHVAEGGHYGGRTEPTGTRQGSYAFTADGRFLGSINSREPLKMLGMLEDALDRFERHEDIPDPSPVQLTRVIPTSDGYPDGGLVLHVIARDLPRIDDARRDDWRRAAWNQDFAWIWPDEARSLVPDDDERGLVRAWPDHVVQRLARFHLRDFVRGEPYAWPPEAIQTARIESRLTSSHGDLVSLAITGSVRLEWEAVFQADTEAQVQVLRPDDDGSRRIPCGFHAEMIGEAYWDRAQGRFTAIDLIAIGPRWGANKYNSREDDLGPAPLGLAFGLAGSTPAERTPPHAIRTWTRVGESRRDSRSVVDLGEYRAASETLGPTQR